VHERYGGVARRRQPRRARHLLPGRDEFWATFTETGTVTFSEAGVDWSGHFTEWGNDNQNETNGNATFTTTINFTASDGSIAQGHDTSHVLWDGVQDPQDPNAVFKLAFDKLRIRDLTCAPYADITGGAGGSRRRQRALSKRFHCRVPTEDDTRGECTRPAFREGDRARREPTRWRTRPLALAEQRATLPPEPP